jgi:hypothetical protein
VALPLRVVLADAQTNGGLLAAVHPERFATVMRLLADRGVAAAHIGEVRSVASGSSASASSSSVPDVEGSVPDVAGDVAGFAGFREDIAGAPALEVSAGTPARTRGTSP